MSELRVPVVDFADLQQGDMLVVCIFAEALKRFGVVRVGGTELMPTALPDDCFDLGRAFMDLPADQKMRFYNKHDPYHQRGYTPSSDVDVPGSGIRDHKEFLQFGLDTVQPNIWPTGEGFADFKSKFAELFDRFRLIFELCIKALERYYELAPDSWRVLVRGGNSNMRFIQYPPFDGTEDVGAMWAGEHEDINLLTILFAQPGLQVFHEGVWYDIPCCKGEVYVNSAMLLRKITNMSMPSFLHRVVVPPSFDRRQSRQVITFFGSPADEAHLFVAPQFISKYHPRPPKLGTGKEELQKILNQLFSEKK